MLVYAALVKDGILHSFIRHLLTINGSYVPRSIQKQECRICLQVDTLVTNENLKD